VIRFGDGPLIPNSGFLTRPLGGGLVIEDRTKLFILCITGVGVLEDPTV
jgi:hypothetical protein